MKFNPLNLFKKTSKGYIGLLLRESDGVIMYLEARGDESSKLEILDSEKFTLTSHWDHLIDDIDDALYKLEVRTKKTFDDIIFFVNSHLIDEHTHELKKQHLAKIKALVKSMQLHPLGFIEAHEAFQGYLQAKEGQPLSGLIVEPDESVLSVIVYQSGRIVAQVSAERKRNLLSDMLELMETLKETVVLPQKLFFFPSRDAEEGADIVEHNWDSKFFSHPPIITLVQEKELLSSLVQTFSTQVSLPQSLPPTSEEELDEDLSLSDIDEHTPVKTQERMGFVIGGAIDQTGREEMKTPVIRPAFTSVFSKYLQSGLAYLSKAFSKLRGIPAFRSRESTMTVLVLIGAGLIIVGGIIMEYSFHKATVSLTLPSQSLSLVKTITANDIEIKESSKTSKFDGQVSVTGVREVGEKSKGAVTLFNSNLSESKTFSKGTLITGPGNIKFSLDTEVKLASASGDAIDIVSSSAKSSVTASAIGPESNLAAGTKFSVADESTTSVIAKNDSGFTGGTKSQIQVVSEKDVANAEKNVITKAQNYVKDSIIKELGSDAVLLKPLTTVEITSKQESAEVGSEASSLSMKANVEINTSYVSDKKLRAIITESLKSKIDKGLTVSEKNIQYSISSVTSKDKDVKISIKAEADAVTPVTEKDILSTIRGQGVDGLQKLAREKYKAISVEFDVTHPISLFKGLLPIFSKNIKLTVLYP